MVGAAGRRRRNGRMWAFARTKTSVRALAQTSVAGVVVGAAGGDWFGSTRQIFLVYMLNSLTDYLH